MPLHITHSMNDHMIKFELYESSNNSQCDANNLGTFVVSISHYMSAQFNYQSLLMGEDFKLPSDAGYLNCVLLQHTAYSDTKLYAKIGCLERDTDTSNKLGVHVFTDKQCSTPYDDGQTEDERSRRGYKIDGNYFSSEVSFDPTYDSCLTCKPSEISDSFSKRGTFWYDDDVISNGHKHNVYKYFDDWLDDYFLQDDAYFIVQNGTYKDDDDNGYFDDWVDDIFLGDDAYDFQNDAYYEIKNYKDDDDNEYRRHLIGVPRKMKAAQGALEVRDFFVCVDDIDFLLPVFSQI